MCWTMFIFIENIYIQRPSVPQKHECRCIILKTRRVGPVDNIPSTNYLHPFVKKNMENFIYLFFIKNIYIYIYMTSDRWHATCDGWQVTGDTRHMTYMTHSVGWTSSLPVWDWQYLEYIWTKGSLTQSLN